MLLRLAHPAVPSSWARTLLALPLRVLLPPHALHSSWSGSRPLSDRVLACFAQCGSYYVTEGRREPRGPDGPLTLRRLVLMRKVDEE